MPTFTESVTSIRGAVDTGFALSPARHDLLTKVTVVGAERPADMPFDALNGVGVAKEASTG